MKVYLYITFCTKNHLNMNCGFQSKTWILKLLENKLRVHFNMHVLTRNLRTLVTMEIWTLINTGHLMKLKASVQQKNKLVIEAQTPAEDHACVHCPIAARVNIDICGSYCHRVPGRSPGSNQLSESGLLIKGICMHI